MGAPVPWRNCLGTSRQRTAQPAAECGAVARLPGTIHAGARDCPEDTTSPTSSSSRCLWPSTTSSAASSTATSPTNGRAPWTAPADVKDLIEPVGGWLADHQLKLIHKVLDLRALAGQHVNEPNVVSWIAGMEGDSSAGNVSRVVREVLDTYPGPEYKRLREAFREWVLGAAQSWGIGEEVLEQVESLKEAGMIYAGVEELKERAHREGLGEGRVEGRAEGRVTLVCRQARLKFGAETAERLSRLLEDVSDPERIGRIGDRIIECETGTELLARAREV